MRQTIDAWILFFSFPFIFALLYALSIFIHELGDILAGCFVGFRPVEIRLGHGAKLRAFHVRNFRFAFYLVPTSGFAMVSPRTPKWFRIRYLIFVLGGPLATGVLAFYTFE